MHNVLNGLPKNAVIDANVLLDAAFVPGLARRALNGPLKELDFRPITSMGIRTEAGARIRRLARQIRLSFDPHDVLDRFINSIPIIEIAAVGQNPPECVKRQDRHVASAALACDGWILTSDIELIDQCGRAEIEARTPWDVIQEAKAQEEMSDIFRPAPPRADQGFIFARVMPQGWAGSQATGEFTVCDIANFCRLYYDNGEGCWVFAMENGVSASVAIAVSDQRSSVVCGWYDFSPRTRRRGVHIASALDPDDVRHKVERTDRNNHGRRRGTIHFGNAANGEGHWNGFMQDVVIGPQGMNSRRFAMYAAYPGGAPNPYDSDGLRRVFEAYRSINLRQTEGGVILPAFEDLIGVFGAVPPM